EVHDKGSTWYSSIVGRGERLGERINQLVNGRNMKHIEVLRKDFFMYKVYIKLNMLDSGVKNGVMSK
ncbi:hypothetical protein A2U01_0066130, partial [Trifolium medium]|nr:hypothetical protein [Trifolium medium]